MRRIFLSPADRFREILQTAFFCCYTEAFRTLCSLKQQKRLSAEISLCKKSRYHFTGMHHQTFPPRLLTVHFNYSPFGCFHIKGFEKECQDRNPYIFLQCFRYIADCAPAESLSVCSFYLLSGSPFGFTSLFTALAFRLFLFFRLIQNIQMYLINSVSLHRIHHKPEVSACDFLTSLRKMV